MAQAIPISRPLTASKSPPLSGDVRIPGDNSISLLTLILAAVAEDESRIAGLAENQEVLATARAMQAFGASIGKQGDTWIIHGAGNGCLLAPDAELDFGAAETGPALTMGLAGVYDFQTIIAGEASLSAGPFSDVLESLQQMGVQVAAQPGGKLPVTLHGPKTPAPISHRISSASHIVKSALLLAGLNTPGITTVVEPEMTLEYAENMLSRFGAAIGVETAADGVRTIRLEGRGRLSGQIVDVPGDPSLAAYALVATLIVPGSDVTLRDVLVSPALSGLIETLIEMGGRIDILEKRKACGGDVADLRIRHSNLRGLTVPAQQTPVMVDDYPALAIAAGFADGETKIEVCERLNAAQRSRLAALAHGLRINGVECSDGPETLSISGRPGGRGFGGASSEAMTAAGLDGDIALGFLVMGQASEYPVSIDERGAIDKGFAGFIEIMTGLGAEIIQK